MEILIVRDAVDQKTLEALAGEWHDDMVKGVADINRGVIALGGEWHMDANNVLLADGSKQEDVWGFNIYPNESGEDAIEYISLINIRPLQGNTEMEIKDETLRARILGIVKEMLQYLNL